MSTQADVEEVDLDKFMRMRSFRRGVTSVRRGEAFDPDHGRRRGEDALAYEAGRQFAQVWSGPIWQTGGRVNPDAEALFQDGMECRALPFD